MMCMTGLMHTITGALDQAIVLICSPSGKRGREATLTDIRTVQELLGRSEVKTTMIYTHVLNRSGRGGLSPLARI